MDDTSLQQTMLEIDKLSKKAEELLLMQKDIKKVENDILEKEKILIHKQRTVNSVAFEKKNVLENDIKKINVDLESLRKNLAEALTPVRELEASRILIQEKKRTFRELLEEKENSILNSTSVIMSGREDLVGLDMQYEALTSDLSNIEEQIETLNSLDSQICAIDNLLESNLNLKNEENLQKSSSHNDIEVNKVADSLNNFASPYNSFLAKLEEVLSAVSINLPEIDLSLFFFDSIVDEISGTEVADKLLFLVEKVFWVKKQIINIQSHILLQENLINHEIDKVEVNKVRYLLNHS